MASDLSDHFGGDVKLGTVTDEESGRSWDVSRYPDGSVLLWQPNILYGLRFVPAERDALRELLDRAAMPGQDAAGAHMPEPAVRKVLRVAFFKGNPDASQDDWRRYCELIGPGAAEKYAGTGPDAT